MNASEHLRLFIAIRIPDAVKDEVEIAQRELRALVPERAARWAGREQFHLTLKFLGDVEAQRFESLAEAVRSVAREFAPLRLRAEGIGFFPNAQCPRVVWVGIRDAEERLERLQRAIEQGVRAFTREEPERAFAGHVTLGRFKGIRRAEAERLAALAATAGGRFFGEWMAGEVQIMRSELLPQGARHMLMVEAPLS
jgi:2'-5' RNA ligase